MFWLFGVDDFGRFDFSNGLVRDGQVAQLNSVQVDSPIDLKNPLIRLIANTAKVKPTNLLKAEAGTVDAFVLSGEIGIAGIRLLVIWYVTK